MYGVPPYRPRRRLRTMSSARGISALAIMAVMAIAVMASASASASGEEVLEARKKLSGIIIPGFASTQLRAWSILDCPYSPLDFNPLDLVWLDTTKV
ncbi:hypothetical protein MLD38_030064 [Melastoma candidum]|uniref:Uncharacterized protein n=1 Tax=Melastoma candidum TaxID=119954 RepID=A0ACB9MQT2_9MYRT|nr:hypothetical protein MLD38_030064 [Melastoma candidum]